MSGGTEIFRFLPHVLFKGCRQRFWSSSDRTEETAYQPVQEHWCGSDEVPLFLSRTLCFLSLSSTTNFGSERRRLCGSDCVFQRRPRFEAGARRHKMKASRTFGAETATQAPPLCKLHHFEVYFSLHLDLLCNKCETPQRMWRGAKFLTFHGTYRIIKMVPYDNFNRTSHQSFS